MRSLRAAFTDLSEDWVEYTHIKERADGFYLGSGLFFPSPEIVTYFSFIGPLNNPLSPTLGLGLLGLFVWTRAFL